MNQLTQNVNALNLWPLSEKRGSRNLLEEDLMGMVRKNR